MNREVNSAELQEERWNTYSHAFGIVLAIIGTYVLLKNSQDTIIAFWSTMVYSFSLLLLFTASTAYHFITQPSIKRKLRVLDHISIYYLIAGTYTPVCLLVLQESKGTLLLYTVWGIALFGTILKLLFTGKFEVFSLLLYGIMGWLIIIDLPALMSNSNSEGVFLIGLGGAFYTLGIVFYALRRIPYNHFIWHLFVLGGAISHWFFVWRLLGNQ